MSDSYHRQDELEHFKQLESVTTANKWFLPLVWAAKMISQVSNLLDIEDRWTWFRLNIVTLTTSTKSAQRAHQLGLIFGLVLSVLIDLKRISSEMEVAPQNTMFPLFFNVYTIFTDYTVYNVLLLILLFVGACVPKYCSGRFRTLLETAVELLSKMWGNGLDGRIL